MKYFILFSIAICLLFVSCTENEDTGDALARKRIIQKIDVAAMGMLKEFEIESFERVDDTTYLATHTFLNPLIDKEMRVTRNYIFTPDLDSIVNTIDVKSEMKSEGEWVKMNF
jgi:hypothetical protein